MKRKPLPWHYRAALVSRLLAAVGGGYAFASATAAAIAVHGQRLGLVRSEAVLWGTLLGFALFGAAAMGCFHCRRAWHAWLGTLCPATLLGASLLLPH